MKKQVRNILRTNAKIISKKEIVPGIFLMALHASDIARNAKPGQFIHIRCSNTDYPLLRRPISLHKIDQEKGSILILFQVKGEGTKILSERTTGQFLDVIGPIGNGFVLFPETRKAMVIGGGIGIAPLLTIAEHCLLKGKKIKILIGAANQKMILREDYFEKIGMETCIATEDGSCQYQGLVTDLAGEILKKWLPDQIFACGPREMLKTVSEITKNTGINCQISLEEKMGCGIGACLGCVCKIKTNKENSLNNHTEKEFQYKRVCIDGPVFNADEVIWND